MSEKNDYNTLSVMNDDPELNMWRETAGMLVEIAERDPQNPISSPMNQQIISELRKERAEEIRKFTAARRRTRT